MVIVEPFAGLGAYSLYAIALEAERAYKRPFRREPPVSRVGSKAGFTAGVFKAWGLDRARWTGAWMNDLCPVMSMLHLLYASDELRTAVSRRVFAMVPCPACRPDDVAAALDGRLKPTPAMLTGNVGCEECSGTGTMDARRLWERIRKEPVSGDVAQALAAGVYLQARNFGNRAVELRGEAWKDHDFQPESRPDDPQGNARTSAPRHTLALRLDSLPCGLATLADVTARALFMQSRSFQLKPVTIEWEGPAGCWREHGSSPEIDNYKRLPTSNPGGYDSPRWTVAERVEALPGRWTCKPLSMTFKEEGLDGCQALERGPLADRLDTLPGPAGIAMRITRQDAALCLPDGDASDVVCVIDPPYQNTTGYADDSSRDDVLTLARVWSEAGALVLLHEAVPLADDLGAGWKSYPASGLRSRGSTFWASGDEREWITASRAPVVGLQAPKRTKAAADVQTGLFG